MASISAPLSVGAAPQMLAASRPPQGRQCAAPLDAGARTEPLSLPSLRLRSRLSPSLGRSHLTPPLSQSGAGDAEAHSKFALSHRAPAVPILYEWSSKPGNPRPFAASSRSGLAPKPIEPGVGPSVSCRATSAADSGVKATAGASETVFFDGGTHYGDFVVNFVLGFTGIWLPLTLTSLFRTLYLRYRFTDRRFTILSGLSDSDRRDYSYSAVAEVRSLPRFIGEWGDIAITLKDKTVVELKSVPKFREVAKYVEERAKAIQVDSLSPSSGSSGKGF